jgi:hypothetical protein
MLKFLTFNSDPPIFATLGLRVMRWLDFILGYIDKNHLEATRRREGAAERRRTKQPSGNFIKLPDVA